MRTCQRRGCEQTVFMGGTRCLDHHTDHDLGLKLWLVCWFVFCIVVTLGLLGVGVWAVIELVTWVTR